MQTNNQKKYKKSNISIDGDDVLHDDHGAHHDVLHGDDDDDHHQR